MSQTSLNAFYKKPSAEDEKRDSENKRRESGEVQSSKETLDTQPEAKFTKRIIRNPDGTIDEILEAPGKPKIIIHKRPGIRFFSEPVKCPVKDCNAYFATDYDLRCHVETHWKPLHNGGGEWIPSEAVPDLRRALLNAEFIVKGRYEYRFAAEGRIIIRKPRILF